MRTKGPGATARTRQEDLSLFVASAPSSTSTPLPAAFDVVHTSNLIDHYGILPVLLVTAPLLRKDRAETVLLMETQRYAYKEATVHEYLKKVSHFLCSLEGTASSGQCGLLSLSDVIDCPRRRI